MLIVCPSCATSYMVDPATLGPAGRTVRCARCKVSWFAGGGEAAGDLTEVVDDVGAESQAHAGAAMSAERPPARTEPEPPPPNEGEDDFGVESDLPISDLPRNASTEVAPPPPAPVPEVVVEAPPLAPPAEDEPQPEPPPEPPAPPAPVIEETDNEDVESFAARRQRLQARRKQKRSSTRWTGIALILFAINVTIVGGREYVVRFVPQTASLFSAIGLPVNLRQLSFENVKISSETQDGVNVLIVQGTIVSTASKPVTVPRLRFAARDAAGQEIYKWTALPSRSILGPGERLEFRSRLASPPADARNILVRFLSSQDAGGSD